MSLVTGALIYHTKQVVGSNNRNVNRQLNNGLCAQSVIYAFFSLSYLMRFLYDDNIFVSQKAYTFILVQDMVVYFDGLSFAVLLYYHLKNFRTHFIDESAVTSTINGDNITDEVIRAS